MDQCANVKMCKGSDLHLHIFTFANLHIFKLFSLQS